MRGVRSIGDRAGSECLGETNAVFRQSIECRRLNVFVTIAVDVVGAEGVDGDQENVGMGCPFLRAAFAGKTCCRSQQAAEQEPRKLHQI